MTKSLLILQLRPEDVTSDSEFEAILKYSGLKPRQAKRMRIEKTGIPPSLSLSDYAAIIVGGSPFNISTPEEEKSPIQVRIENDFRHLLEHVVRDDFPFLGICSGCTLLGSFLGASISARYAEKVGAARVHLTDQGAQDPLLSGFPPPNKPINVLLGHKEACDQLPPRATLLMTNNDCPVQMIRVGENVYATQFHPEGDGEVFTVRINTYMHHGYFLPNEANTLIASVHCWPTPYGQEILHRFAQRYIIT